MTKVKLHFSRKLLAVPYALFLAVFFIAIPFERRHKMDPFVRYDIEDFE
jgi:hypothetical protein